MYTHIGRGDDPVGNPHRAQTYKFELLEVKFINPSFSSLSSYRNQTRSSLSRKSSGSRQQYLSQQHPAPLLKASAHSPAYDHIDKEKLASVTEECDGCSEWLKDLEERAKDQKTTVTLLLMIIIMNIGTITITITITITATTTTTTTTTATTTTTILLLLLPMIITIMIIIMIVTGPEEARVLRLQHD